MSDPLLPRLLAGIVINVGIFALALFLPARTLHWWRGWAFVGALVAVSVAGTIAVYRVNRGVIEERLRSPLRADQPFADKIFIVAIVPVFIGWLAFIPLDVFRFHLLPPVGPLMSGLGLLLFFAGFWVSTLAMMQNEFAAASVRYQEERHQHVVDTGVYAVVRHPMYAGAAAFLLGIPLWLQSYAGALLTLVPIGILAARILLEERFLRSVLEGYDAYMRRVPYRLIPRVW